MGRLKNFRGIDEGLCRAVRICCVGSVAAYMELMSPTTNLIINGGATPARCAPGDFYGASG